MYNHRDMLKYSIPNLHFRFLLKDLLSISCIPIYTKVQFIFIVIVTCKKIIIFVYLQWNNGRRLQDGSFICSWECEMHFTAGQSWSFSIELVVRLRLEIYYAAPSLFGKHSDIHTYIYVALINVQLPLYQVVKFL